MSIPRPHRRPHPLRRAHAWRERVRSRRSSHQIYRVTIGLVGTAIVVTGILLLPLPGPGWGIIFVGLAVLASEFAWARRLQHWVTSRVQAWLRWARNQPLPVRMLLGLGTALVVAGCLYLVALVSGVPGWVPDALVPPLPGLEA